MAAVNHAFIVTGSRDWTDAETLRRCIAHLETPGAFMIVGGARGADRIAEDYWANCYLHPIVVPAMWDRDGKSAGPIRNAAMLRVLLALRGCGYTVSVEAFSLPQSVGTRHMKAIALAEDVTVNEHGRTE